MVQLYFLIYRTRGESCMEIRSMAKHKSNRIKTAIVVRFKKIVKELNIILYRLPLCATTYRKIAAFLCLKITTLNAPTLVKDFYVNVY